MRLTRLIAAAAFALTGAFAGATEINENGLHVEPWFAITFKDVAEDIAEAADQGKRLAIIVEQAGCIYCAELHEKVLSDPEVRDYITENFMVVQFNMFGDEEIVDIDGETMTEREAIRRWAVTFTPTVIFLPENAPEEGTVRDAAVAMMPGAFSKRTSLHMFQWVREHGYEGEEHFQKYHARKLEEERATEND
jgi:thioredoxin-related protein